MSLALYLILKAARCAHGNTGVCLRRLNLEQRVRLVLTYSFQYKAYRLTSAGARPHLTHDFTKSSITNNFLNINLININLAFLDS